MDAIRSNFRWLNSDTPLPDSQASEPLSNGQGFFGAVSGYIPIGSSERPNEEEAFLALSRWERFLSFLVCCAGSAVCFFVAFFTIPMIAFRPAKFAVSFSMGNILFILAFTMLQGPRAQIQHLANRDRAPFTLLYFASLALTLYFALGQKSYLPTLVCAIIQVLGLASYLVAYFPGGSTTLLMGGRIALRGASSLLPV